MLLGRWRERATDEDLLLDAPLGRVAQLLLDGRGACQARASHSPHVHDARQAGRSAAARSADGKRIRTSRTRRRRCRKRAWLGMARATRSTADYLRYRTPEYRDAAALYERAAARVSPAVQAFSRFPVVRTRAGLTFVANRLRSIERAIPPDPAIVRADREPKPRCRARHAAHRARLGSGGVHQGGPGARHSLRLVRPQLGQPDEQGADSRSARTGVRLERGAAQRGRGPASRFRTRTSSSPARPPTISGSRVVRARRARSSAGKSGCRRSVRSSSISARRSSSRRARPNSSSGGFRRCAPRPMPRVREAAVLVRPHPRGDMRGLDGPELTRGRTTSRCGLPEGANPVDTDSQERLLRFAVPLGRCCRDQHERADRGWDRWTAGVFDPRGRSTSPRKKGRSTFTICSTRTAGCCTWRRRSRSTRAHCSTALDRTPEDEQPAAGVRGGIRASPWS